MLDTNIISYIIKNRDFSLIDKFEKLSSYHIIAVSSITVSELYYGVKKKASIKLEIAVSEFLLPLEKMSFDENASLHYGEIRSELESKGKIIGAHDLFIAAHARSINATLITNNTREFNRVSNLKVEDWSKNKSKYNNYMERNI